MEWMRKCPVFLLLAVSGLLFSLVGIIGRHSVYSGYEFDVIRRPFLSLMMEGIGKGVAPWEACDISLFGGNRVSETATAKVEGDGQSIEDFAGMESVEAGERKAAGGTYVENGIGERVSAEAGERGNSMSAVDVSGTEMACETEEMAIYEFQVVSENYFNDAIFIGDSRTVGLFEYGGLEERADFFAKISLTIYDVFTEPVAKDETGKRITVEEALTKRQYGKVYLMLGINELGTGTTQSFMEEYTQVVEKIRQLQPDAIIFVEGIMRVTGEKDANDPIFNNANINEKNDAIAELADNRDIFYIDVNEAVCDEMGNLNEEYTIDEIHLKAKYYEIWKEFLMEHGIVK